MPAEHYIMEFTFKLVFTDIWYKMRFQSNVTMKQLHETVVSQFSNYIDSTRFDIILVVAGQPGDELASGINIYTCEDHPLFYEFGDKWKQISFYVRPVDIQTGLFVQMNDYHSRSVPPAEGTSDPRTTDMLE